MAALQITTENFEIEVLKADKPVLLDFWAPWCGPCQVLLPVIEELAEEVGHAKICKVNIDEEMELAKQFRVLSVPTLVLMNHGEKVTSSVGVKSKEAILEMINVYR